MNNNYFGDSGSKKLSPQNEKQNKAMTCIVALTSVFGLLSLIIIIILNVVNLSSILSQTNKNTDVLEETNKIKIKIDNIQTDVSGSINPKLTLINTATSYSLPTLISNQAKSIKDEIYKYCVPRESNPGSSTDCPKPSVHQHSQGFSLYDPNLLIDCNNNLTNLMEINKLTVIPFSSFIPSPTTFRGCTRIPTMDIGEYIYSYSHNIIHNNCNDNSESSQYWSLGKIIQGQNNTPVFEEVASWYLNDGLNRKSCSTVVSGYGAWLACNIVTVPERDDYKTPGIMDVFLGYFNIYGLKKQWILKQNQITFDHTFNAFYFSVGPGIIQDGQVYLLAYGNVDETIQGNAYCPTTDCIRLRTDQEICNRAQRPSYFGGKQIVSAIFKFQDSISSLPTPTVTTIPVTQYIIGAEGRLYKTPYSNKFYIYLRSTSWYGGIQFGEIDLKGNLTINWFRYTTFERPGADPCTSSNRCPGECITGVYTDSFLLSMENNLAISVELTGGKLRRGPQIKIADMSDVVIRRLLNGQNQVSGYTTTTCFIFEYQPWCISIVEMSPGTIGITQPVSLLYPIWSSCNTNQFKLPYESRSKYLDNLGNIITTSNPIKTTTTISTTTSNSRK